MLGGCPRVAFATINNVKKTTPPDVHAMQNFEVGNVTEAVVARAMDNSNILLDWWTDSQDYAAHYQQKDWKGNLRDDKWTDEELGITGTPDCICKVEDKIVLVDVKTASTKSVPFTLRKIKKGNYWEESYGYKMQLACYMLLMERRFEAGLEKYKPDYGKLVIIDKNNGSIIAEPTLSMTDGLRQEVINRIEYLNEVLKETDANNIPCTCAVGWMKYFGVSYCNFGELDSMKANTKKLIVPTRCCNASYINNQLKK